MRYTFKDKCFLALLFGTLLSVFLAFPISVDAGTGPQAVLPQSEYDFGTALEGNTVIQDFVIQNKGDEPLIIHRVRTGCGCTAASSSGPIPPGGEGMITLKFNTEGYGGRRVRESASVETNDVTKKNLTIALIGKVEKFAIVSPDRATMIGAAGNELKTQVTVSPTPQYPFKVTGMRLKKGDFVKASYEWKDDEKKAVVQIENRLTEKGRYADAVILTTDSPIKPEIHIPVYGILR